MKIPANIQHRYVSAVEREAERARLYDVVIAAEHAASLARRAADDAAYGARIARETLEDFEADCSAAQFLDSCKAEIETGKQLPSQYLEQCRIAVIEGKISNDDFAARAAPVPDCPL